MTRSCRYYPQHSEKISEEIELSVCNLRSLVLSREKHIQINNEGFILLTTPFTVKSRVPSVTGVSYDAHYAERP